MLCFVLTSLCTECVLAQSLSSYVPLSFPFPTTVTQHQNTNWHLRFSSPCQVFSGISTRRITHASASSLSLHNLGWCLGPSEHVWGEGRACRDRLLLRVSFCPIPSTLGQPFNYHICAMPTVGSEAQLWEAGMRADLEKERLYSKVPAGFIGHYIGERLAELKALAVSLPSAPAVFAHNELLFLNPVCWNMYGCAAVLPFAANFAFHLF